jgi:hypothetical protein
MTEILRTWRGRHLDPRTQMWSFLDGSGTSLSEEVRLQEMTCEAATIEERMLAIDLFSNAVRRHFGVE